MWVGNDQQLLTMMKTWRRDFHRFPELSNNEKRTSQVIANFLAKLGLEVRTYSNHYAVCGIMRGNRPGPVIALRADMDALPIQEENDVAYKSEHPGIMHACGHDAHMAILMGTAAMLSKIRSQMGGTVKLIFQPAEEAAPIGGANAMMQEGILDDAAAIFGLHVWPDLPTEHIGIRPGPFMAASDRFVIKINGRSAHAAHPHQGIDAITIAAEVIQGIGTIMSRQLNPLETATLSIGSIHGGERYNVIAKEVVLEGTIRTLGEEIRLEIPRRIENLLAGFTTAHNGSYTFEYYPSYPVLVNWEEPTQLIVDAGRNLLRETNVHLTIKPALGAEDFARYLTRIPGAFFWLGCSRNGESISALHNSKFDIDENALLVGAKLLYQTTVNALKHYAVKEVPMSANA